MTLQEQAHKFTTEWYERPESGKDRPTLTYLIYRLLLDIDEQSRKDERNKLEARILKLLRSKITFV